MERRIFWSVLLAMLMLFLVRCVEEKSDGSPEDDGFVQSEEDFPEHEPIMQPFDEDYEEEQAAEKKRVKEKASEETETKSANYEDTSLPNFDELFENEFKAPEFQHDGMADHEPVYQPEDPGEFGINYPFHVQTEDETDKVTPTDADAKDNDESIVDNVDVNVGDVGVNVDDVGVNVDDVGVNVDNNDETLPNEYEDDHEPVYQPEDSGEEEERNDQEEENAHDEL